MSRQFEVTIRTTVYADTPEEAARWGVNAIMESKEPVAGVTEIFAADFRYKDPTPLENVKTEVLQNTHYHSKRHVNFCCPSCTDKSHGIDGMLAPGRFGGATCWCYTDLAEKEERLTKLGVKF